MFAIDVSEWGMEDILGVRRAQAKVPYRSEWRSLARAGRK